MYAVSSKFKEYCKRNQRNFKEATITYYEDGVEKTITSADILKITLTATPYIDYQIIGQAVAKKVHVNLKGDYDLVDKEINLTTTMIYDDETTETLNLGTYIVSSDYESTVKEQGSFTAYDYMIKLDTKYDDTGLEYPCTLQDVLNHTCEYFDITNASPNIVNGDLAVEGNNFGSDATFRDVVKQIAMASGTFAYLDRDNQMHIDPLMDHDTITGEGNIITLTNTAQYGDINDYALEGNIEQYQTTGKQLFDFSGITKTQTKNGVTYKINDDGSITISRNSHSLYLVGI